MNARVSEKRGNSRAFRFEGLAFWAVGSLILAGSERFTGRGHERRLGEVQAEVALVFSFALKSMVKAPPRIATSATLKMAV